MDWVASGLAQIPKPKNLHSCNSLLQKRPFSPHGPSGVAAGRHPHVMVPDRNKRIQLRVSVKSEPSIVHWRRTTVALWPRSCSPRGPDAPICPNLRRNNAKTKAGTPEIPKRPNIFGTTMGVSGQPHIFYGAQLPKLVERRRFEAPKGEQGTSRRISQRPSQQANKPAAGWVVDRHVKKGLRVRVRVGLSGQDRLGTSQQPCKAS
jgi:hypothetical protein